MFTVHAPRVRVAATGIAVAMTTWGTTILLFSCSGTRLVALCTAVWSRSKRGGSCSGDEFIAAPGWSQGRQRRTCGWVPMWVACGGAYEGGGWYTGGAMCAKGVAA